MKFIEHIVLMICILTSYRLRSLDIDASGLGQLNTLYPNAVYLLGVN